MNNKSLNQNAEQELKPKLRFPEFRDEPWLKKTLGCFCTRLIEKVGKERLTPVSITAGRGFVSQKDKFGKDIAGAQYKNYIFLKRGDFAYNKGNSKKYPQGYVCQLKEFDQAACPNAFICFRLEKEYAPGFIQGQFDKNEHGKQLAKYITSGARSDGLLNINPDEFFNIVIPIPVSFAEQHKIADCLSSIDEVIAGEAQKLEKLKAHKRGMTQNLFPAEDKDVPALRFPGFQSKWKYEELGQYLDIYLKRVPAGTSLPIFSSTRDGIKKQTDYFDGRELINDGEYGVVPKGYIVYRHMSDDNIFRFNINHFEECIAVSKEYPVFRTKNMDSYFLLYLLNESIQFKKFASEQKKGGTRTRLYFKVLCSWKPLLPNLSEQLKIAECLSTLDEIITSQSQKLEALKSLKRSLLQQLFPLVEAGQ